MLSMPCASVFSQVSDLSLLGNLTGAIPGSVVGEETESEDQTGENEKGSLRLNQETNFEDENYGYTGGLLKFFPPVYP